MRRGYVACGVVHHSTTGLNDVTSTGSIRGDRSGDRPRYCFHSCVYTSHLTDGTVCSGANVLKIMRELGTLDDILAHTAEPGRPNIRGFRYVFGAEGHKEIMTVRPSLPCCTDATYSTASDACNA